MDVFLIKNGLLMAVLGILAGLPFTRSIKRHNEEQWRITHLSGIVGGTFLIALGVIYDKFTTSDEFNWWVGLLMIVSNWLFLVGTTIGGFSGKRGLSPKSTSLPGRSIFVLYCTAALLSTIGTIGLLIIGVSL